MLCHVERCGEDLRVRSAPAKVAADSMFHVVQTRIWIALQVCRATHHHAGSAETALHGIVLHKSSLYRMHSVAVGEPLNRRDLASYRVDGKRHTGQCRGLVDPYRTRRT